MDCFSSKLSERQQKELLQLYDQVINSYLVLEDGTIVMKEGGMPSGCGNTIVDNTMILYIFLVVAYILLCRRNGFEPDYFEYISNVLSYLGGDDSIIAVTESYVQWYNHITISEVLKPYGLDITYDNGICPIQDLDFFSQKFRLVEGCYLPIANVEKLLSNLFYEERSYHPLNTLLKALAIRIETWPDVVIRRSIQNFISYWLVNHITQDMALDMGDSMSPHVLTYRDVMQAYLSDRQLRHLYTGVQ